MSLVTASQGLIKIPRFNLFLKYNFKNLQNVIKIINLTPCYCIKKLSWPSFNAKANKFLWLKNWFKIMTWSVGKLSTIRVQSSSMSLDSLPAWRKLPFILHEKIIKVIFSFYDTVHVQIFSYCSDEMKYVTKFSLTLENNFHNYFLISSSTNIPQRNLYVRISKAGWGL